MAKFTPFTGDAEIEAICSGFMDRTLPKSQWTHAAHFSTSLWFFTRRPDIDPSRDMPAMIRTYNESVGGQNTDTGGYHETITQASLRAACDFLSRRPTEPLFETCNQLMASPLGNPYWLLQYWSRERLFSVEARRAWLAPDLRPLPF
jgi:hypothetical protein